MLAITQSQSKSHAKPTQTRSSSNNIPGKFNLLDLLVPQEELIFPMSDTLKKLLTASSDLSKHFAAMSLDLPTTHIFANLKEFYHVVASDRAHLLHLLVCINQL